MRKAIRSPYLDVESIDGNSVQIRESMSGNRAVLDRKTFDLLDRFALPREVPEGNPGIERLLDLGILLEPGRESRPLEAKVLTRVSPSVFGSPPWRRDTPADFVLLGAPFDIGNRTAPGARFGPDALRSASALYPTLANGDRALGCIDYDTGDPILEGARLVDGGDIYARPSAGADEVSVQISRAISHVAAAARWPVLIGGDHSVTFGAIRGLPQRPFGLVHFDAHPDWSPLYPGQHHHYGNVVSRIVAELGVRQVVHIGVRGFGHDVPTADSGRRILSPRWVREHSLSEFLNVFERSLSWYVSIDIDVLDPAHAPGTATPVPGGLTPDELKVLLRAIGRALTILGGDLVEINPSVDRANVTGALGCELLLTLLGAIWRGRK